MFDVIERLKEGNDPDADPKDAMEIDRAKAIAGIADKVIKSAKIEVDAMKLVSQHAVGYDAAKHLQDSGIIQDTKKMLGE